MDNFIDMRPAGSDDASDYSTSDRLPPSYCIRLAILNRSQLAMAFGEDAAVAVVATIVERANEIAGPTDILRRRDGFDILLQRPKPLDQKDDGSIIRALECAFGALGVDPVIHDGHHLFAGIGAVACVVPTNGSWASAVDTARCDLEGRLRDRSLDLPAPEGGTHWRARYVADMRSAALAFEATAEDRIVLTWQPIVDGEKGLHILYSEGLARIVDPLRRFETSASIVKSDAFVPALERLGLIRAFDAHVVRLVMTKLASDPRLRLGCNISAQSAVIDGWWTAVLADLAADPALAARLTIEITETARLVRLGMAMEFARTMQSLRCRIAINDFGRGHIGISDVAALEPDIIKINAYFLRRSYRRDELLVLWHLVGLARALALHVIIEGVGSLEAKQQAVSAGARWLQGDFLAAPAMSLLKDRRADETVSATSIRSEPLGHKPGLGIPPRHWAIIFSLSAALWGLIGFGAWGLLVR